MLSTQLEGRIDRSRENHEATMVILRKEHSKFQLKMLTTISQLQAAQNTPFENPETSMNPGGKVELDLICKMMMLIIDQLVVRVMVGWKCGSRRRWKWRSRGFLWVTGSNYSNNNSGWYKERDLPTFDGSNPMGGSFEHNVIFVFTN